MALFSKKTILVNMENLNIFLGYKFALNLVVYLGYVF